MSADDEIERYLSKHRLVRRTENTHTTKAALLREIETIRAELIAIDREEYAMGLTCMAVPVGRVGARFAVGLSGPTERVLANLAAYTETLRQVANG
jgi:IclR family transcriptional regulator, acetate operon repressor